MPNKLPASVLLDTNILLRLVTASSPLHPIASDALRHLADGNAAIYICPQNMQEFRQVATRPSSSNGFDWTSEHTADVIDRFEAEFQLVSETPAIYSAWRRVVEAVKSIGRSNYDARIVAIAHTHQIEAVLTFESTNFTRFGTSLGVAILNPSDIR